MKTRVLVVLYTAALLAAPLSARAEAPEINRNKREAAEIYLQMSRDKSTLDDILAILNDPQVVFTTVPQKTMIYAEFMHKDGMIKLKPDSWRDMFFPNAHKLPGS